MGSSELACNQHLPHAQQIYTQIPAERLTWAQHRCTAAILHGYLRVVFYSVPVPACPAPSHESHPFTVLKSMRVGGKTKAQQNQNYRVQ